MGHHYYHFKKENNQWNQSLSSGVFARDILGNRGFIDPKLYKKLKANEMRYGILGVDKIVALNINKNTTSVIDLKEKAKKRKAWLEKMREMRENNSKNK